MTSHVFYCKYTKQRVSQVNSLRRVFHDYFFSLQVISFLPHINVITFFVFVERRKKKKRETIFYICGMELLKSEYKVKRPRPRVAKNQEV